jgi:hypothetical protein
MGSRGMRLCDNAYIQFQFNTMSMIKNAYVCVVNGEPELFETQQQAEDHAMELSFAWYDANLDVPAPRLAVMSVTNWLQLQSRLALV